MIIVYSDNKLTTQLLITLTYSRMFQRVNLEVFVNCLHLLQAVDKDLQVEMSC